MSYVNPVELLSKEWTHNSTLTTATAAGNSTAQPAPAPHSVKIVCIGILFLIITILTLTGNGLVIAAVARFRHMRSHTNLFVVSLAGADLLVGVIVMPLALYQHFTSHSWHLGQSFCVIYTCCDVMFTTTSIFHLCCLATDRFLAICKPFFYSDKVSRKSVIVAIVVCWVVPLFISFLPILNGWNETGIEHIVASFPDKTCIFIVNRVFAIVCSSIAFYIPSMYMAWCNIRIYLVAKRQVKQIRIVSHLSSLSIHNNNHEMDEHHHYKKKYLKRETKAAKTIVIIMGVYTGCWLPFFVCNVTDPFIGYRLPGDLWLVVLWLGYTNSMLNPFLYYFFNRKFREAFQMLIPFLRRRRRNRQQAIELSFSRRATVVSPRTSDDRINSIGLLKVTSDPASRSLHRSTESVRICDSAPSDCSRLRP